MNTQEQIIFNTANRLLAGTKTAAICIELADGKSAYLGDDAGVMHMLQNKDQSGAAVRGEAVAEFNINDMMIVTLTAQGAAIWNQRYADLPLPADLVPKNVGAGHVLKSQLWELMQVFGPHIGLCRPPVFVGMLMAHAKPLIAPVSDRTADAPSEPSEQLQLSDAKIIEWAEGYLFSQKGFPHKLCFSRTSFINAVRTILSHSPAHRAADALDSQPTARPTVRQLAAQLCDGQTWTVAEQNAFAEVLACFPNESSQGIISLGDAWKHGQAYERASSQPTVRSSAPDGWISVKDGLPELGQTVLAVNSEYGQRESKFDRWPKGSINRSNYGEEAGYFKWQEPMNNWGSSWEPTHWRQLLTAPASSQPTDGGVRNGCIVPPTGWYCTRIAGHDGPCAAYPNDTGDCHE